MTGQYASYANSVPPCKLVCQNNDSDFVHENRFARLLDEVETDVYTDNVEFSPVNRCQSSNRVNHTNDGKVKGKSNFAGLCVECKSCAKGP